jgi:hypothetical protein
MDAPVVGSVGEVDGHAGEVEVKGERVSSAARAACVESTGCRGHRNAVVTELNLRKRRLSDGGGTLCELLGVACVGRVALQR